MKTKQIIKMTLSFLLILGTFTACVEDKDFDTPQIENLQDVDISNTSMANIIQSFVSDFDSSSPATLVKTFEDDDSSVITAYVVSDDTKGNFYKKLIVQDKYENPTAAIEIRINQGRLHSKYNVGRKIYIKLAGLSLGYFDGAQGPAPSYINQSNPTDNVAGVYKLGVIGESFAIDRIDAADYENYIERSPVSEVMVPKMISTTDFTDANINTFVQIDNLQFVGSELGKTYADEDNDSFDAERILLSCDSYETFGLMTSTFSSFKTHSLPENKGTVVGVLAKNYRENDVVIVLNSFEDVNFTDTNRCRIDFCNPDCTDSFDSGLVKWDTFSIIGNQVWETTNFGNPGPSAKISGYSGGSQNNEDWLISKPIDLTSASTATLTFDTVKRYNGPDLEVYMSSDYTGGDPTTNGTWTQLSVTLDTNTGSWTSWTSSGNVDVSAAAGGDLYIAFKYISTTSGSATFEVDNVALTF